MPKLPKKVVLLGSGGLTIGQAGEFDYSGTQAIKALREEGVEVVLVNPNIATVQTNPEPGVRVYLYPVTPHWIERVIAVEKPDALIAGFGGQTALNCALELERLGVLSRYEVNNLGTSVESLRVSEDRGLFADAMRKIDVPVLQSVSARDLGSALSAAQKIGFPVMVRASFALGGLSSGIATDEAQFKKIAEAAFLTSPELLIEKSLRGWKEVEYEVMRDSANNAITICNMENFDPLGVHTGDSIVVTPSQTLTDEEYQQLRNTSLKIAQSLKIVGECNVQFALDPESEQFYVIEINARLSRSSALASKASGYPIAYIAAKLVLGYSLLELKNPVTGITSALYEPALDYVTVKVPRWDLTKFHGVSRKLGSAMKSVGEVMAIARSFPEAMQKAYRMSTERPEGLCTDWAPPSGSSLESELAEPTDQRVLAVVHALRTGMSIDEVHERSRIDRWFLNALREIIQCEGEIRARLRVSGDGDETFVSHLTSVLGQVSVDDWRHWKQLGFGDEQIAALAAQGCRNLPASRVRLAVEKGSLAIRSARLAAGVRPVIKKIDTTAAEHPSPSNYLYLTYSGSHSDISSDSGGRKSAIVLGSGAYRIGTSVEFDWCAVSSSRCLRAAGWRTVIVNCNPETVSTDYSTSDRLYFDELSLERILDIAEIERPEGVVLAMGGQLPNRLALPLARTGMKLLGHDADTIDQAEDRVRFSAILDRIGVSQPRWASVSSPEELKSFLAQVGFPVLVRPSYVLSGASMNVAYDDDSLQRCLDLARELSPDYPVVVSEFLEGAQEIEVDGVSEEGVVLDAIVSEHVEDAGVHSGDATMVLPPRKLDATGTEELLSITRRISKELRLHGPFNVQFLVRGRRAQVIECNARASRSFPFASKVTGRDLAALASRVMIGDSPVLPVPEQRHHRALVGVKAAMFSFNRLSGADPLLRVEMASTGEVGCVSTDFNESLLLALEASGVRLPKKGVLVSSGPAADKLKFLSAVSVLESRSIPIFATPGTAKHLVEHGHQVRSVAWPEGDQSEVLDLILRGDVDLVINIPKNLATAELRHAREIRLAAVRSGRALLTDMEKAVAFLNALADSARVEHRLEWLPPFDQNSV